MIAQESHQQVLNRDLRRSEIKPLADELRPIMVDLVNEGTWILREAFTRSGKDPSHGVLAIPFICHSQLEMLDALSELVSECIFAPAKLISRSIWEAYFYCRFIHENTEKFEKMSTAYVYEYHRQYMRIQKKIDQIEGKESLWIDKKIKELSEHGFKEVIEEHERRRKINKPTNWYSLFDGPGNMAELTDIVMSHVPKGEAGDADTHKLLYTMNSLTMHVNDVFLRMSTSNEGGKGKTNISGFRTPNSAQDFLNIYGMSVTLTMHCLQILLERNCTYPQRRGIDLWIKNIQPRLQKVQRFCQ